MSMNLTKPIPMTDQAPAGPIQIAILDDHQGIIDGYRYRLDSEPDMEVVAEASFGDNLEVVLQEHAVDLLILDVYVPTSATNQNPYPILYIIPRLLDRYPNLVIIVISVIARTTLIKAVMDAGVSGYILKDDRHALQDLSSIVRTVVDDGVYMSRDAQVLYTSRFATNQDLSKRQLEALSLCAAYPEMKTSQLAQQMGIAHSTLRNLLSQTYLKLGVSNRSGAILIAQRMGLIAPPESDLPG